VSNSSRPRHVAVAIVGAGPVGLTAALDLHHHGISAELFDQDVSVCEGSRAIAWAQHTLEIFDRLGVGKQLRDLGTTWKTGKVFWKSSLVYAFDLQPEEHFEFPPFVNLPQYELEMTLLLRLAEIEAPPIRWAHRLVGLDEYEGVTRLTFETPSGPSVWTCDYLVAADGSKSTIRKMSGLDFKGKNFDDKFLIADVRMKADFPAERWFWFDPPFNPGQSALLHRQPDNLWRIDLQLGPQADPEEERRPDRVTPRIRAMLGPDRAFELVWVSVYSFQCRRLDRFRSGSTFFVGDSAHQVSPFGGRGGNSGIQDVDNLVWKLALVIKAGAPERLLDSYDTERCAAADENMLITSRSTDFISPKDPTSQALRDAVLELSTEHAFARAMVKSGRLSQPSRYPVSELCTLADGGLASRLRPGMVCPDAPIERSDGSAGRCYPSLGQQSM
jgi:3-(3-hydroxy-phenyl)propionate hydroxylase